MNDFIGSEIVIAAGKMSGWNIFFNNSGTDRPFQGADLLIYYINIKSTLSVECLEKDKS